MLPYTATDSLNAISRELGTGNTPEPHDHLSVILHRQRRITPQALLVLYERAGRAQPAADINLGKLLDAGPAVGAWDGERLIGFARALSDGQLVAYIEEVVIDPQYREQGLGQVLVGALLAELAGVAVVNRRGSTGSVTIYERRGAQSVINRLLRG